MGAGMLVSGLLRVSGVYTLFEKHNEGLEMLNFSEATFFFGFLPPILFNSGFHMRRRIFYSNMDGILSLAFMGSIISTCVLSTGLYILSTYRILSISMTLPEIIAFSSMISSTDPVSTLSALTQLKVDSTLFYLVFGESLLSDSICVTLFRTVFTILDCLV